MGTDTGMGSGLGQQERKAPPYLPYVRTLPRLRDNSSDNPTTAKAAATSLNARGDDGTGWSEAWKLNCWARLEDGEHAYNLVKLLISPVNKSGRLYDNLWDAHPPFQIDGNFGFTSGMAEMLLQSQNDVITLLPALPSQWSTGHANGLCARGNFEVTEMSWENGRLEKATILSKSGGTCTVRYGGTVISFETEPDKIYKLNGELKLDSSADIYRTLLLARRSLLRAHSQARAQLWQLTATRLQNGVTLTVSAVNGYRSTWAKITISDAGTLNSQAFRKISSLIRADFVIQASSDGESWTDIANVYGNTKSSCGRNTDGISARYVRLEMLTSTQNTEGGARVYELEIWGKDDKPPVPKTAFRNCGASAYNFKYGEIRKDDSGKTAIGYITDGSYIVFRNIDFESGAEGFRASAASATEGGTIEIRIDSSDGELIGECPISGTDGWSEYVETGCKTAQCTGAHDVYLVFKGGDGYLFNVNSFGFYGIKGDINGDRVVDIFDMVRYRKALIEEITLSGLGLSNADMNADKETGVADALLLQKYLLGKT